jgi:CubicO group peptidase (beta-lactamase class C family)
MERDSYGYRAAGSLLEALPTMDPRWRRYSENGFAYSNARSLAKLGSILACGGSLYGDDFMSPETARLARQEHVYLYDPFLDSPVRRGLGVGLASKEFPLPFPNAFHWGGYGGSLVIMEPDRKACWSYVPTKLDPAIGGDSRGVRLITAACLDAGPLDRALRSRFDRKCKGERRSVRERA